MLSITNSNPRWFNVLLSSALFIMVVLLYQYFAIERHIVNPNDKLIPSFSQLADGFIRFTFLPDKTGEYRLWSDTLASGERIIISMIFIFAGILIGVYMGLFPIIDSLLYKFILFFDKIPAIAVLPILFIVFGLGEVSKIALIVIGVVPTVVLDTYLKVKAFPQEQIVKAMTLRASSTQMIFRIVLPKIFPQALDCIRLNFKAVILFLISGEALAATSGLGYRIFVVRRYLAMDIIITYVIWISLLAFIVDLLLSCWIRKSYSWHNK